MGKLRMKVSTEDQIISKEVFVNGAFEKLELEIIERMVREGMVVADIGANIGVHTLVLADCAGPAGKVHAFEPTRAFERLNCNVQLNHFGGRCDLNNIALGAKNGYLELCECEPGSESLTSVGRPLSHATGKRLLVPMESLDGYADRLQVKHFDFVKIDVEGAEVSVLEGAKEMLKRKAIRIIMLEFNSTCLMAAGSSPAELHAALTKQHGFRLFGLDRKSGDLSPCVEVPTGTWDTVVGYAP
jgi:FkbM family methyltransferase